MLLNYRIKYNNNQQYFYFSCNVVNSYVLYIYCHVVISYVISFLHLNHTHLRGLSPELKDDEVSS